MAFQVQVLPRWEVMPGEQGDDVWTPVYEYQPERCTFDTEIEAKALVTVCTFAIMRLNHGETQERELRIAEV